MSGCEPFRERLQEALDERLDPAQRPALEEHLRGCAACAHEAAGLRRLRTALRALPRPSAPPGFREGVERRIAPAGRLLRLPHWLAAAAAAAVVVAAVSVSTRRSMDQDVALRMPVHEASEAADAGNGISLDDVSDAIAEDEKPGAPDAAAFESKARDERDVGLRAGAAQREGPAGEIAAESRRPTDPGPPGAPAGTAPSPEAAHPPAGPPSAGGASAAPSADPVPPPRVRLVVFRDRAAADRFVAAMATSAAAESGAPRGLAEPGADAGRRAPGAAPGRAPKGERPRAGSSDDRAKDAPAGPPGETAKEDAGSAAIPEIARLGLATPERLAAARAAATAEGGGVSEPIAFPTSYDATVPADVARAVAAELRRATPPAPVTGPQATGAGPSRDRDVAGGGAVGGGATRGAPGDGGSGAGGPTMKKARRSEDSDDAPPAGSGAWEAADAASAATEILIVVVVPDTAPSAPPR